jgi:hypothetical protein
MRPHEAMAIRLMAWRAAEPAALGQFRLGKMPAKAIHWIIGAPGVNVKTGFPVGSAKVVIPSPP